MLRKSFINLCYHQHTLDNLCRTHVRNQNVRLYTFYPLTVPSRFPQGDNITSISYRRYSYSLDKTNSENTKTENYELDTNISKPSIDDIIKRTTYKERCIQKIVDALECSFDESSMLFKEYPFIFRECIDQAIRKINSLKDLGFSKRSILENAEILEVEDEELLCRINEMNEWGLNESQKSDFLVTLGLDTYTFNRSSKIFKREKDVVPFGNRFIYFSNLLQCPLSTIVNLAMKYNHLICYDFDKIDSIFKVLLESGVSPRTIQNRIWLSLYRAEQIKNWQISSNKNLQSIENEDKITAIYFRKCVERDKNDRLILKPNQTRAEFLSEKLNVEIEVVEYVIATAPFNFDRIDLGNAVKVIDFLFSEGYKGIQICLAPSILKRDVAFVQKRLTELRSFGGRDPTLYLLNSGKKMYERYCKRLTDTCLLN